MQLLRVVGCAIAAVLSILSGSARAVTAVEEFWEVYPPAEERLDRAYSQVRIKVESRSTRPEFGEVVEETEYLRNGHSVRGVRKTLRSIVPDWPAGAVHIMVGDNTQWYELIKARPESPFTFIGAGAPASEAEYTARVGPLFPTRLDGFEISKLLRIHPIIAVSTSTLDGLPVVEVRSQRMIEGKAVGVDRYYFDPDTWVVLGLSLMQSDEFTAEWRMAYRMSEGVPVVRSRKRWRASIEEPELTFDLVSVEVKSVEFGPVPAEEFTLESMGITQRPSATVDIVPSALVTHEHGSEVWLSHRRYWVAALIVALLGAIVYVLTSRRKGKVRG